MNAEDKNDKPYDVDDDGYRDPWCRDFEGHKALHEFCCDHQMSWCRGCDRMCPACVDDPHCPDCGCSLFTDYHDWDCGYADEDDDG
jgi:hypothetical protein